MSQEDTPISTGLSHARCARRLLLGLFIGFIPIGVIFINISLIPIFIYMGLYFAAGVYLMSVQCPECGELYFKGRFVWHPFAKNCCHCGR